MPAKLERKSSIFQQPALACYVSENSDEPSSEDSTAKLNVVVIIVHRIVYWGVVQIDLGIVSEIEWCSYMSTVTVVMWSCCHASCMRKKVMELHLRKGEQESMLFWAIELELLTVELQET